MESKTIMKRNLQFYKPANWSLLIRSAGYKGLKYECITFIPPNRKYKRIADMNKLGEKDWLRGEIGGDRIAQQWSGRG